MTVDTLHPVQPSTIDGIPLHVNDAILGQKDVGRLRPSYPTEPLEDLRKRYREDGYVFLKGLLPREDVLAARAAYFDSLSSTGVLKPDTAAVEGLFNPDASPADYPGIGAGSIKDARPDSAAIADKFVDLAIKAHTADWYCGSKDGSTPGFCNHPALLDFISRLSGWGEDTLAVRRTLLRNYTPGNKAIGVHYDQIFLRHGEPTAVTAWVPIGDVALEGGGLIYLEQGMYTKGHRLGEEIENEFAAKAKADGMSDGEVRNAFNANMMSTGFLCDGPADFGRKYGKKWLVTEYEAGDVVLHTPHMIHASTINHDANGRIRLGTDLRFVNSARPWDTRWSSDFTLDDGL